MSKNVPIKRNEKVRQKNAQIMEKKKVNRNSSFESRSFIIFSEKWDFSIPLVALMKTHNSDLRKILNTYIPFIIRILNEES